MRDGNGNIAIFPTTRAATVKVYVVLAAMNVISTQAFGLEKAWVHDARVVLAADECHFHFWARDVSQAVRKVPLNFIFGNGARIQNFYFLRR